MNSQLRQLVGQMLQPQHSDSILTDEELDFAVFDDAAGIGAEAIAGTGMGLDHVKGERVLAGARSVTTAKGQEHRACLAITDRYTLLSGSSTVRGGLNNLVGVWAHRDIQQVESKVAILSNYVKLIGAQGNLEISAFPSFTEMLTPFYQTIAAQIPPAQRMEPATPFITQSDDDPAGARAAVQGFFVGDTPGQAMLERVEQVRTEGHLSNDDAAAFVGRILLLHRSRAGGTGMSNGWWMSPMIANDFGTVLSRIYGHPTAQHVPGPGQHALDFYVPPGSDPTGKVMDALGVASYVALGVGFSPAGMIAGALVKKQPTTQIRIVFGDTGPFCSYKPLGPDGRPLERHDVQMAHRLHQALIAVSVSVLQLRAQHGWSAPLHQLM